MLLAIGLIVALLGALIVLYNRLVGLQKRAQGAWADIDAQLKRRHDLIPALVEVVKGYAAHEKNTLEAVIQTRTAASRPRGNAFPTTTRRSCRTGS